MSTQVFFTFFVFLFSKKSAWLVNSKISKVLPQSQDYSVALRSSLFRVSLKFSENYQKKSIVMEDMFSNASGVISAMNIENFLQFSGKLISWPTMNDCFWGYVLLFFFLHLQSYIFLV